MRNMHGFGRIIGIDYDLVVPDDTKTLKEGAVKPWQTKSYHECQQDLLLFAHKRGIPSNVPWRDLTDKQRHWVLEGEGRWEDGKWYGVKRFFQWLETKSYRMHIRVLLSKYRAYKICPECTGARLKPQSLLWRIGKYNIHELMLLPIESLNEFFAIFHFYHCAVFFLRIDLHRWNFWILFDFFFIFIIHKFSLSCLAWSQS